MADIRQGIKGRYKIFMGYEKEKGKWGEYYEKEE